MLQLRLILGCWRCVARGVYLLFCWGRKTRYALELFRRPGQFRVPHGVDSNRVRE